MTGGSTPVPIHSPRSGTDLRRSAITSRSSPSSDGRRTGRENSMFGMREGDAGAAPRPRINGVGTGYLGATHAAAMAELGFDVIGVDTDPAKIELLSSGRVPFHEPGLEELIAR